MLTKAQQRQPLTLDNLSQEHLCASINWFVDMSAREKWNLSVEEAADLLGGIPARTYHDLKRKAANGHPVNINRDMAERLSLFLGIWKALQIIVPSNRKDLAYAWFNQVNNGHVLMGKSIKDYLLERKSIEALYTVRRYLDAIRG